MKKKIMFVLVVLLISMLSLTCLLTAIPGSRASAKSAAADQDEAEQAENSAVLTEKGNLDVDVYAKMIHSWSENYHTAEEENGSYLVETADGTVITVTPESADTSLSLIVYEITADDTEAHAWFMECTEGLGDHRLPYEIYFVNESGDRVEDIDAQVTITLPEDYGTPLVYQISSDGTITLLSFTAENGVVSFDIASDGFYMLMSAMEETDTTQNAGGDSGETDTTTAGTGEDSDEQTETGETETTGGNGNADDADGSGSADDADTTDGTGNAGSDRQVQTGDDTPAGIWMAVLLLSMTATVLLFARGRKPE